MTTEEKVRRQAAQLTIMQQTLRKKNLALDALYYVWCDGGCAGGVQRWVEGPMVTEELVVLAERNTRRLRDWFENRKAKSMPAAPTPGDRP